MPPSSGCPSRPSTSARLRRHPGRAVAAVAALVHLATVRAAGRDAWGAPEAAPPAPRPRAEGGALLPLLDRDPLGGMTNWAMTPSSPSVTKFSHQLTHRANDHKYENEVYIDPFTIHLLATDFPYPLKYQADREYSGAVSSHVASYLSSAMDESLLHLGLDCAKSQAQMGLELRWVLRCEGAAFFEDTPDGGEVNEAVQREFSGMANGRFLEEVYPGYEMAHEKEEWEAERYARRQGGNRKKLKNTKKKQKEEEDRIKQRAESLEGSQPRKKKKGAERKKQKNKRKKNQQKKLKKEKKDDNNSPGRPTRRPSKRLPSPGRPKPRPLGRPNRPSLPGRPKPRPLGRPNRPPPSLGRPNRSPRPTKTPARPSAETVANGRPSAGEKPKLTPKPTPEPIPKPTRAPIPKPTRTPTPKPIPKPTRKPTRQPTPEPIPEPNPEPTPEPPQVSSVASPITPPSGTCSASSGEACAFPPGAGISTWFTQALFNEMFPNLCAAGCEDACAMLTYPCLIQATLAYPSFANSGERRDDMRELAAWLGIMGQETTGGGCQPPGTRNADGGCRCSSASWCDTHPGGGCSRWGLCKVLEAGGTYCSPGMYPCVAGRSYRGRGPKQLSWNYNYGAFSAEYCGDPRVLLENPDWVATNPTLAWASSIWFWHSGGACDRAGGERCKPSPHAVFTGKQARCPSDVSAKREFGLGWAVNVVNGGLECGSGSGAGKCDYRVYSRVRFYRHYCAILGVAPLADGWTDDDNLFCGEMKNYSEQPPGTC